MAAPDAPGVLVTRPAETATALAGTLVAMGYRPILSSALEVRRSERVRRADVLGVRGLIMTSAAAARALAEDLGPEGGAPADLPTLVVGATTARAAREAGLAAVETGPGDAGGLLELLLGRGADPAGRPYLVLRGRETALDLADALMEAGIAAQSRQVYAAEPAERLAEPAVAALEAGAASAALLLSARTSEVFLRLVSAAGRSEALAGVAAVCVSPRAAAPAQASGRFARVVSAARPTLGDTLAALRVTIPPQQADM